MGLEGVELLLTLEEEFQIAITDEEAQKSLTPNLLTDVVWAKLKKSNQDACPSQKGFYVVRRNLVDLLRIPRTNIKPETPLHKLIEQRHRSRLWPTILSRLSNGQKVYAPLERPIWIKRIIYLFSPILLVPTLFFIYQVPFALSLISTLIICMIMMLFTKPLKMAFPKNYASVKDLIKIVGTLQSRVWERNEVYQKIKDVIVKQIGIKEDKIQPDSHFYKDLGIG